MRRSTPSVPRVLEVKGQVREWGGFVHPHEDAARCQPGELRWLCASVTQDPEGKETRELANLVSTTSPPGLLVDAPRSYRWAPFLRKLKQLGYHVVLKEVKETRQRAHDMWS